SHHAAQHSSSHGHVSGPQGYAQSPGNHHGAHPSPTTYTSAHHGMPPTPMGAYPRPSLQPSLSHGHAQHGHTYPQGAQTYKAPNAIEVWCLPDSANMSIAP